MKKIGIITIQKCNNFGADLQAFALQKKLMLMGYEAENIDYVFYKNPRHLGGKDEKPVLPLSLVNRVKEKVFPLLERVRNFKRRKEMSERAAKFEKWFAAHVKQSGEYRSVESLYANPPKYDVYMVGSDQVWNPRMGSNILPYFLDFAPRDARKVSYAASLGVSELPTPAFLKYREWLNGFSHVGLREARGAELINRMKLDAEVKHVLDPTLLLTAEEWASVSDEVEIRGGGGRRKFLLLYDLIPSPETTALAKRVAAKRGLHVVRVGDGAYGPGEFIWLFAHAECVVTNSFHGTAFSLIHAKDFVSIIPRGMTNASRIESVLKVVGLESQLLRAEVADSVDDIPAIDWSAAQAKLAAARTESVDFLQRAIVGEKHVAPRKAIGNVPKACYAVWNPDAAVRAASTSGGVFTWLAEATIRKGGVVYGAAFDADFKHVHHIAAQTIEELAPLRKSKYVYSDATAAIKEAVAHLKSGREVLFTGCPCQCAAMKAAAKDCAEKLITVDFVCHGTPRPEVFAAYADELEKRHGAKLVRYEFRDKRLGWCSHRVSFEFNNGERCSMPAWVDSFSQGFYVSAFLRPGCYSCPFATLERVSDITIADCWRIAASHPQWDDNHGTSLILTNTEKGVSLTKVLGITKLPGGLYPLELAEKRNAALMQPASRAGYEARFDKVFAETGSFESAASCYMTSKRRLKYRIIYWVKRLGWFYFRKHQ